MNSKNRFKQAVIKQAVAAGIKHSDAMKEIEQSFRFYPKDEWETYDHCDDPDCLCGNNTNIVYQPEAYGATVGSMSYGGNEYGENQMWPAGSGKGIEDTYYIREF